MQTPQGCTGAAIVDRLRVALGAESDGALARALGASRMTVSSWRTRDTRPYAICVQIAQDRGVSLDWLLTGEGEISRPVPREAGRASARPEGITYKFAMAFGDDGVADAHPVPAAAPTAPPDGASPPLGDAIAYRIAALAGLLTQLDPEHSDAILADALSRASDTKRLAELEEAVSKIAKPHRRKRA